ncbi:MAG: DUF2905 domain-containing protein [Bacillota bacterium]|jgi:hypothetical protein
MGDPNQLARLLIFLGLGVAGLGLLILIVGKVFPLGRLPGDIYYSRGNFSVYFPLATMLILSLLLTIAVNLFFRR